MTAPILDQEQLAAAGAALAETVHLRKWLTTERDETARPHKTALDAVRKEYAETLGGLETTEGKLRAAVLEYLAAVEAIRQEQIEAGQTPIPPAELPPGLSLRRVPDFVVTDQSLIPAHFWRLDETAIRAALAAGETVPGVAAAERDTLVISARKSK